MCNIFNIFAMAQQRGAAKFISSLDHRSDWDSVKTAPTDSIRRSDVVAAENTQSRRARYRTTTEKSTVLPSESVAEVKTSAKVPSYRVRGRSRSKQDTEPDKKLTESTTAKVTGESNQRTGRRKSYQSNKQRTNARNENQSTETNNKDGVSSTHHATQTISSRKYQASNSETEPKSSTELPVNHQPDNHRKNYSDVAATRKSTMGRRYRIRVVEANSINANGQTAEIEKKAVPSASTTDDPKSKVKKPERDSTNDEPNYPEHFKALLKSKKSTVSPNAASPSSRTNHFAPKKPETSTTPPQVEATSTSRPAFKHKKIERPNLKLLFPSLHASSTTTESNPTSATIVEVGQTSATDEIDTDTIAPVDVTSTTAKIRTTIQKQVGGIKFSSKIRTENNEESPTYRSRSTPLIFDALRSSTQRLPSKSDTPPTNHRFSPGTVLDTPKFSARYKSGEGTLSLAAYRKNLVREKPPFYTPTTPPITTQVNEIDWAASDYSYGYVNDVEPIRSGLMQNPPLNVETSHHSSSSVTVSIFGALSEILSHTTESLSFLTSTTTEHTPQSHTHSTFLSTDNTQIQKIQSDKPKIPSMTGDSTFSESDDFRLPIFNTFESNEAIANSRNPTSTSTAHTSNEQVDAILPSYFAHINNNTINAFSSTALPVLKSNSSDSLNSSVVHHSNQINTKNSNDIMIILATSDRSSMQNNRTAHAIKQTEQTFKMQNNTIADVLLEKSTTQSFVTTVNTEKAPRLSTRSSETVIPIYPIHMYTTISPNISSHDNQSHSINPSIIDRTENTTNVPSSTPTMTTLATETSNFTQPTEHSVNISIYDLDNSKMIINNNQLNVNGLNRNMTHLLNQTPSNWEQTMTNNETFTLRIDLTTIKNKNDDLPTIGWNANTYTTEQLDASTIATDASTTAFNVESTESIPIEITTMQSDLNSMDTTTYVPQFKNRIAIVPIGFYSSVTTKRSQENVSTPAPLRSATLNESQVSNTSPITIPTTTSTEVTLETHESNRISTASPFKQSTTPHKSRRFDFVVYGILSNNTVIRRYPEDIYDDEADESGEKKAPIVYGILSNNTVLKKFPNGTTKIDEKRSSRSFEITNINPISLFDPNSPKYKQTETKHGAPPILPDDANSNNQSFSTKNSKFNLNNTNTSSASSSNYDNANSTNAPTTSVEQLTEYLRKSNSSQVHTKSENVFSLASPSSVVSSTNGFGANGAYRPISLDDYDSLPSSNEVTSNESSFITSNTESDPFSLSNEFDNKIVTSPKATSPKSTREYITSFTTTTTTTQKPHIEKGVKIIRELVESARATETPDVSRPIQSLTTTKSIVSAKEKPAIVQKPKTTSSTPVPANHRPTWAMNSTTTMIRQHSNHNFDGIDSTEKTVGMSKTPNRSTSPRTTTTTTLRTNSITRSIPRGNVITNPTTRLPTMEKIKTTTTELPISVNDIEDLLQNIPTTTGRGKTTTVRTKSTTPAASDNNDLGFLRQVQRLLQRPTSTRMPIQTKGTTSTSSTATSNTTPKLTAYTTSKNNGPTSTFDDLLNSFQKEPTTTSTRRPQLTTFSDADDIAFLNGLRQIAVEPSTTKTPRNPDFAKQIINLAIDQTPTGKQTPSIAEGNKNGQVDTAISADEIEKNKKDVASLNSKSLKLFGQYHCCCAKRIADAG